jgi:polyphosphate kinase
MTLIVRREGDVLRRYAHIGTGNYHSATARLYEDVGIFTADEDIAADVADLFNYITGFGKPTRFRKLLVAPFTLRSGLVEEIRAVAAAAAEGEHARIRLKVNHLVDPRLVEELYLASQAGAQIDVVARTTCALRPGVENLSENIRVRSLVGRFLEHGRIYSFEAGDRARTYLGSADLMQRNLDHRIEVLAPVENARMRQDVHAILDSALADDTNAWLLGPEGEWTRATPGEKPHSHHATMVRRAQTRARRRARARRGV